MDTASLSNEELIDQVTTWAARVARGDAQLLALIEQVDAREAWAGHGVRSCAHWLSWKLGWSKSTSRERVRVARALSALPLIREAFSDGRLTYSQVRAITRIATAHDEPHWLDLARHATGEQLDKAARGAARAVAADRDPSDQPAKQAVRLDWDGDGDLVLTLRIPAHEAVAVLAALEQHQAVEQTEREAALAALMLEVTESRAGSASADAVQLVLTAPDSTQDASAPCASAEAAPELDLLSVPFASTHSPLDPYVYAEPPYPLHSDRMFARHSAAEQEAIELWRQRRDHERAIRDAWNDRRERLLVEASARRVQTGRATLADALVRAVLRPTDCAPVTVQLLHDPLSGWARTQHDEMLPPLTLAAVLSTLPRKRTRRGSMAVLTDLTRYDQGRTSRTVGPALRQLLGAVDGERCRFPGCNHTRFLHAHHLQFWRDGGSTDLANLVLLCTSHHRLLHTVGYVLTLDEDRQLSVTCPDGTTLLRRLALPAASAEALPPANASTLDRGDSGDRFDLGYVVHTMLSHAA